MFLTIHTAPPNEMRYATVGDWEYNLLPQEFDELRIKVTVAQTGDNRYNILIGVHELAEALVMGIRYGFTPATQLMVDKFDLSWKASPGAAKYDEPGDDPAAPYHFAHVVAGIIERILAYEMGVDWERYAERLDQIQEQMENARK